MDKKQTYITDEERENCQKVVDAFVELFEFEDLTVVNAGKYGFVKLQYYRAHLGFDNAQTFINSKSLFNDLWDEWLDTQLLNIASDTPMAGMDYEDILKCLPPEKQKELLDMRLRFAEKTGIENILEKNKPDLSSGDCIDSTEKWSRDLQHFVREQAMEKSDKERLLEILAKARTVNALDEAVGKSHDYGDALSRQDKAFDGLDGAGLTEEQKGMVDRAISAANDCGAVYGAVAYRLGLQDGIRLTAELNEIK